MRAFLLLVFLALPLAGFGQQGPPPAAVETAQVERRELAPVVTVTGQVQSRAAADLAAGVAGALAWVAEPGTAVKEGGLVARIDTAELELARAEQAARVTRGEIQLRQLRRELERLQASGNAVSRHQLDQAEAARDLAAADLEIARAALRQTAERLERAEVRSPFPGVVAARLRRIGEELARGDVVARVMDPRRLEIRLFLPLRHVQAIAAGDPVLVREGDRSARARVRAIVPAGDARSQSFEVLVDLPATAEAWTAGAVVQVELPLGTPQSQLAVPRDALILRSEGVWVYRVVDNQAQRIAVSTGIADGDWVAVQGPLRAGEAVVVRGAERLQDGAQVNIIGTRTAWQTRSSSARSAP